MKRKIILAVLGILIVNTSFGQSAGNVIYNNPGAIKPQRVFVNVTNPNSTNVILQADVMINMKATSYVAIFSVTQNGKTALEADSLMNLRLKMVTDGLKQMKIKEKNIHVDVISLVPTYAIKLEKKRFSRTANEIPTGFQMKKNLHVIFYEHNELSEIVSLAAKAEIYDIVKVDYNLADIQAAYDSLMEAASRVINRKERLYAKMGLHLEVQNMTDGFNVAYPIERYASYTAFNTGSSIEEVKIAKKRKEKEKNVYVSGKNQIVNVNNYNDEDETKFIVKHQEKKKTIYYNKVPYNQFDNVINADFVDPRIQFYYTLKVRYTSTNQTKWDEMQEVKNKRKKDDEERAKKGWFKKK
ncbi:MAG: SIMPL domain-containing protein [Saprospiraceae bacterium]|nr:SIMPL domain-containing protein [Saprospiraceae bacterium]